MAGMTTLLDRVVAWNLDLNGDLYGDERERLRWYEGIATAASMQWMGIPWAAAIMVWLLGKPSVLPLFLVLLVLFVPMGCCTAYVRGRRVDTEVHAWSRKRVVLSALFIVPVTGFIVGALYAYGGRDSSVWRNAALGGLFGCALAVVSAAGNRRRARRKPAAGAGGGAGDED
jgi:hypothetical protein